MLLAAYHTVTLHVFIDLKAKSLLFVATAELMFHKLSFSLHSFYDQIHAHAVGADHVATKVIIDTSGAEGLVTSIEVDVVASHRLMIAAPEAQFFEESQPCFV